MLVRVGLALNFDDQRAARVASTRRFEKKNQVGAKFRGSERGEVGLADTHGCEVGNRGMDRVAQKLGSEGRPLSKEFDESVVGKRRHEGVLDAIYSTTGVKRLCQGTNGGGNDRNQVTQPARNDRGNGGTPMGSKTKKDLLDIRTTATPTERTG
jgi:hypothetical protein